jgi:hypothetical protein
LNGIRRRLAEIVSGEMPLEEAVGGYCGHTFRLPSRTRRRSFENMKKCLVVLTGIMTLLLFASTASASYILCGQVGSAVGNSTFLGGTATPGAAGTATLAGATATLGCNAITVPLGSTLTEVQYELYTDAGGPGGNTLASINFTWTAGTGISFSPPEVLTLNSTAGISFDQCSAVSGPVSGACPIVYNVFPGLAGVAGYGPVTLTVSALAGGGGGVSASGNVNADLFVSYSYTSGTPEPATLSLIGGALLGLGVFAKKLARR